jgi:ribosomal protein L11 methylase PrmA
MEFDKGSFRDPAGKIFYHENEVFRYVDKNFNNRLNFILENDLLNILYSKGLLIKTECISTNKFNNFFNKDDVTILKHEKIPYISYPYEWCFSQLKAAAIHHLDLHLFLLEKNATLIDASAYNIQFIGSKPVFIDVLSIKPYQEGEFWFAHKQFCENFLNPLILYAKKKIKFNNWFKGNLEGVYTEDLNNILSFFDKFSYTIFTHVYLMNKFNNKFKKQESEFKVKNKNKLSKKSFVFLLKQLRNFILSLKPKKNISIWENYSTMNTYNKIEENNKKKIVEEFIKRNHLPKIIDLGCNDGVYSKIATNNNNNYVVGFDFDDNSIDRSFCELNSNQKNFLPLILDASNPSSNIGWNENERKSFKSRAKFDGLLALAFEHHLCIAKNIPLEETIKWMSSIAPKGLIEFVPKNDSTVQKMLSLKGDIFPNYSENHFFNLLSKFSKVISVNQITDTGRKIYEYKI